MKKLLVFAILTAFISITARAQDAKVVTGYLVDKMCASSMAKKAPAEAMAAAAKHTRNCAMEKDCAAAGYGVMSDGKWIKFDDKGNEKAADYLKHTKAKSHLMVEVNGSMNGDVLAVSSIKEAKAASKKSMKKTGA
jgi:hypothetical protein